MRKDASETSERPQRDIQDLIEDLRIHQAELEAQNEELRKAYGKMERLKESYANLYDFRRSAISP